MQYKKSSFTRSFLRFSILAALALFLSVDSLAAAMDFDGDGKSDMSVYRGGEWHINKSAGGQISQQFGLPSDTAIPADYDGDGKTDLAIWRPSNVDNVPDFYLLKSSDNTMSGAAWGAVGDTAIPADYDGDGRADFAVYRQGSDLDFFVLYQFAADPIMSSRHYRFGRAGDRPVVGDYDGDGKADFAVFRPSNGAWCISYSSAADTFRYIYWGIGSDKLAPADYDGDGKMDAAIFRESSQTWYIHNSSNGQMKALQWGMPGDRLAPADYDGDGKADIAAYRNGQWMIMQSSDGLANISAQFGNDSDLPLQSLSVR